MNKIMMKAYEFEILIGDLFRHYGYKVESNKKINNNNKICEADLVVSDNNKKVIVESKIYQTRKASYGLLKQAILKLKSNGEIFNIENNLLVVASSIDDNIKSDLEKEFQITIYDSKNLIFLVKSDDSLYTKYVNIMSDIPDEIYKSEEAIETHIEGLFIEKKKNNKKILYSKPGENLFKELENIKPGKKYFSEYENKCTDILKYLFTENLNGWHKQYRTDDGINRFDLVCRVKLGNEFWQILINELKSRYIIFEFKNYSKEIKQTQIYTTEKYLYQTALRNVGFIISRKGASKNAIKSTKGILRETGKLIINLKDDDLKEMLAMKDSGNEPSDYLFNILDKFLLELEK